MLPHLLTQTVHDVEAFGQFPCNGVADQWPYERNQSGQHTAVQFRVGDQRRLDCVVPLSILYRIHCDQHDDLPVDVR